MGEDRMSSRVSVYRAAEVMGVTVDAIRKRITRGTIDHERDEDGRVWVILDIDQDASSNVRDPDRTPSDSDALISEMRDRIQFLEDEHRRKDAILLNMTEAMKALSPPEREATETVEAAPEGAEPHPGTEEPQEGIQRPWWRRWFGR